jgi:hypothetical protein
LVGLPDYESIQNYRPDLELPHWSITRWSRATSATIESLGTHHAVYVADMSRMPSFVTRNFALPSLREQPFTVGVNLDEKLMADWPRRKDTITLIRLEAGRVISIAFARTAAELKTAVGITTP